MTSGSEGKCDERPPRALEASVLIATRDRAGSLERTLESLARQSAQALDWELIVVDNGSTDDTKLVLDRFASVLPLVSICEPRPGKNRALNRALEDARGQLLVFTDDDVVVAPNWLASLVAASHRWPDVAVLGGPIEPVFPPGTPDWMRAPDFVLASEAFGAKRRAEEGLTDQFPFGANLAIRARIFGALRFDEAVGPVAARSYPQGSEYELLSRLRQRGERFVHVPDARVLHIILPHQVELEWLFGRAERVGRGAARIKRKRVPKTFAGWVPLFFNLWRAKWRAHRARKLDDPDRFRIAQRVHYWRGYIAESRALRGGEKGVG